MTPADAPFVETDIQVEVRDVPRNGLPPAGTTRTVRTVSTGGAAALPFTFPPRATAPRCDVVDGSGAAVWAGDTCTLRADGPATLRWSWSEPTLRVAGEWTLDEPFPTGGASLVLRGAPWALALHGDGLVETRLPGGGVRVSTRSGLPAIPADGWPAAPAARVVGWVPELEGVPILPSFDAAISAVARAALLASVAQPGAGLGFAGVRPRCTAALPCPPGDTTADRADIHRLLQERVRAAVRPARDPLRGLLAVRPLAEVRRAGWGSPWEIALWAARLLRGLGHEAVPAPVRPAVAGPLGGPAPMGFSEAVVRIAHAGEVLWWDPSCAVCAPGEVGPALGGGQPLARPWDGRDAGPDALAPPLADAPRPHHARAATLRWAEGRWVGDATVQLNAAAARELRAAVAAVPASGRASAIAAALGFPGAQVVRVRGFGQAGAAMEVGLEGLVCGAGGLPLPLSRPSPVGGPRVSLAHLATVADTVQLEGREPAPGRWVVEESGLAWSRAVQATERGAAVEEQLRADGAPAEAARTAVARFATAVHIRRAAADGADAPR